MSKKKKKNKPNPQRRAEKRKKDKGGYAHAWGWKPTKKSRQQAQHRRQLAEQYNRPTGGGSIFVSDPSQDLP